MNDELDRLQILERRMDDIEAMLRGHRDSGEGGVVHVLQRIVETVYGPSNKPGGLVEDVGKMKRIMWIGVGMMLSIEVLGKVFSWFNAIK